MKIPIFLIATMGCVCLETRSQELPDPPVEQRQTDEPDFAAFAPAYARAGEPRVMFLLSASSPSSVRQDDGMARMLQTDIEQQMLRFGDLKLVDAGASDLALQRDLALRSLSGDQWTTALKATTFRADLAVMIDFRRSDELLKQGVQARVRLETIDVTNGRKLPTSFSFDWLEPPGSESSKRYAGAIARRWVQEFNSYYLRPTGASRSIVVSLLGVSNVAAIKRARDCFAKIDGVSRISESDYQAAQGSALTSLELKYNGSWLDLADALQSRATKELGMQVAALDGSRGAITLANRRSQAWEAIADPSHPDHRSALASFADAYRLAGSPRMALAGAMKTDQGLLGQTIIELERSLSSLGVSLVAPIDRSSPASETAATPALRTTLNVTNSGERSVCSLQTVRCTDNLVLAAVNFDMTIPKGSSDVLPVIQSDCRDAACHLAYQLQIAWSATSDLRIIVRGSSGVREANAIRNLICDNVTTLVNCDINDVGSDASTCSFTLHYTGSFESMLQRIQQLGENGTFRVELTDTNRQALILHVLP